MIDGDGDRLCLDVWMGCLGCHNAKTGNREKAQSERERERDKKREREREKKTWESTEIHRYVQFQLRALSLLILISWPQQELISTHWHSTSSNSCRLCKMWAWQTIINKWPFEESEVRREGVLTFTFNVESAIAAKWGVAWWCCLWQSWWICKHV